MEKAGATRRATAAQTDDNVLDQAASKSPEAETSAPVGGLTRVTVNLNRQAMAALETISEETGHSKTDTINRALQVYKLIQGIMRQDGGALSVRHTNGEVEKIVIL
jgi:hypothetical protein